MINVHEAMGVKVAEKSYFLNIEVAFKRCYYFYWFLIKPLL